MSNKPVLRCAIYTRKSSEEGLGQEFNSLDAQREACAAYVASQRHEGWRMLPERYDDGGLSGGTLERPALQRLLADIDAGRVQMVVVYKIDRLTRSLADFAKLVERLEKAGCSFVSVTQAFNTSSSMGRLTLNVLLSFAQFEREVTAERIRDKIAASKRKGMWMGGTVPLGYDRHPDPQRRELVINAAEAEIVRTLFRLYDELGCLRKLEQAATEMGCRSKHQTFANGTTRGGRLLSRGQLHYLLTNTTYRGLIRHKDEVHPGLHPALVDQAIWDRVQARLQERTARPRGEWGRLAAQVAGSDPSTAARGAVGRPSGGNQRDRQGSGRGSSAALLGLLRDDTGDRLTPTHTVKDGQRIRYYVSHRLLAGPADRSGWRLPGPGRSSGRSPVRWPSTWSGRRKGTRCLRCRTFIGPRRSGRLSWT
ncbi:resolvase [Rubellimicrobium mesophilum DSM 19309]|uniref:Resolvase n=1 Tax=Rubellimicrobium mesophilum DSM 19309 TaxID=442562 RepID=A0A017HJI8_9RHOB|nr:recombinase family protein [Rubellimicrobium mesophilum]EYD74333.1 resolvase [Rubellimicrobium mesophilum DSM 19309]